jgi:hypothetical protein
MKGICNLSLVAVRAEPGGKKEMVTQLLYGETYDVLEEDPTGEWIRIQTCFDAYQGWISSLQFEEWHEDEFLQLKVVQVPYLEVENGQYGMILSAGSIIGDEFNVTPLQARDFQRFNGNDLRSRLSSLSKSFINAPYLWGGRSFMGFDCSGFTQVLYKIYGIKLPRDAYKQAEQGELVSLDDAEAGDLAFFHNEEGKVTHVGMMLDDRKIIHASGDVRIDSIRDEGIFHKERSKITHKLKFIKRYI